jgi:hypothetical protein
MRTKKTRTIRYSRDIQFQEITHTSEMAEEEVRARWYTSNEFKRMRNRESEIVRQVAEYGDAVLFKNHTFDATGIETFASRKERRIRTHQAISCVLAEQRQQSEIGYYDPKLIARIYSMTAKQGAKAAYRRGLQTAEEIQNERTSTTSDSDENTTILATMEIPQLMSTNSPKLSPRQSVHRWTSNPLSDTSLDISLNIPVR